MPKQRRKSLTTIDKITIEKDAKHTSANGTKATAFKNEVDNFKKSKWREQKKNPVNTLDWQRVQRAEK